MTQPEARVARNGRQPYGRRIDNRRDAVLDAAAREFAKHGYGGTSMRDIAAAAGMLGGSVYYHFKTKADLLLEAHQVGIQRYTDAFDKALQKAGDAPPWDKFTMVCCAHLQCIHNADHYARLVRRDFMRHYPKETHAGLIAQRDAYERTFARLVAELPLKSSVDPRLFRHALIGALSATVDWYRPGGKTPTRIAEEIVEMFRRGVTSE
ncbi:MAG: TetR/AcrR family transcriptional regulator [Burkholderiaceae bacterium]